MCINLSRLLYTDFDLKNITASKFTFSDGNQVSHLDRGRNNNLLHLLLSGSREYEFGGQTFTVPVGTVLFIPDNTLYRTTAIPSKTEQCSGIGICFDVIGEDGKKIAIEPNIYHEWEQPASSHGIFHSLEELYSTSPGTILKQKILLYQLLHNLISSTADTSRCYSLIKPAISFIVEHYNENLPVSAYAEQCKLSESYFRKKFIECTGMSPIDYRNQIRFNEAKRLYQKNYTIQEIAEIIGFCDAGHFSKLYKRHTGSSLKKDAEIV